MSVVDFLRERLLAGFGGDDVIADRRHIRALSKARGNFLVNRREAWIDMMKVDRGGISRLSAPEISDGSSQQAEHPAYPLKGDESRRLASECG
jgi:hypothetical protein